MEIIVAFYLAIAGSLYAAHKDGIIPDDTTLSTYKFEAHVAELKNDKLLADYLNGRVAQMEETNSCSERAL